MGGAGELGLNSQSRLFSNVGYVPNSAQSCPIVSIQAAILDRFGNVSGLNPCRMVEVSQCAGNLQNAVIGAGAEADLGHGMFEMLPRVVVDLSAVE